MGKIRGIIKAQIFELPNFMTLLVSNLMSNEFFLGLDNNVDNEYVIGQYLINQGVSRQDDVLCGNTVK